MLRVVLDTAVMVAALQSSTGASRLLLRSCLEGRFTPLLSTPLLIEYETVLTRPERLAESTLTQAETLRIIDALLKHCRTGGSGVPLEADRRAS